MRRNILVSLIMLMAIVVLAACGGDKYAPVAINEDTDKCAICNMQVKDDSFATQLTTTEGKNYKFDDLGCMNEWKAKNSTTKIGASYVRDYNDKEWVKFEDAYYAYDPSFRTPMAYGIYSFKDEESAKAFIASEQTGTLLTADQLATHDWARVGGMGEGHSHEEGGHDADSEGTAGHDGAADKGEHTSGNNDSSKHDSKKETHE